MQVERPAFCIAMASEPMLARTGEILPTRLGFKGFGSEKTAPFFAPSDL
jgi:hypothetical protein